ncbi:Uncharacterised protein [Mycobacteroides abscessus subsp. massiliense]|nr:Uncharacterised protein [Mycobacteroides abscessus subsp. massiliense]
MWFTVADIGSGHFSVRSISFPQGGYFAFPRKAQIWFEASTRALARSNLTPVRPSERGPFLDDVGMGPPLHYLTNSGEAAIL